MKTLKREEVYCREYKDGSVAESMGKAGLFPRSMPAPASALGPAECE
jgi:hypothetical protein